MVKKQKQCTNADLQPNKTYTRQHLNSTTLQTGATHRHLHKNPKRKGSRDFPERVVQPWRPQPRVPPAWFTELVPRVARVVRPTARTGFWGNWTGFSPLSRCGRGGEWQALRTGTAPTDSRRPLLNRTNRRKRTPTEQNQNERCTGTLHAHPFL